MKTDTGLKILEYIKTNDRARPTELVRRFGFTQAAIHRQLNKLLTKKIIEKVGTPPKVYYQLAGDGIELEIKKALTKNPKIISAYILGSYLSGNTDQESDFDLAVIVNKNSSELEKEIYVSIQKIKFPRNLDLSIVDKSSSSLFLFEIVKTGKRIYERSKSEALAFEDISIQNYGKTETQRKLDYEYLKKCFNLAKK